MPSSGNQDKPNEFMEGKEAKIVDMLICYFDNVCTQKFEELDKQVKFYTQISKLFLLSFCLIGFLTGLIWLFKYLANSPLKGLILQSSQNKLSKFGFERRTKQQQRKGINMGSGHDWDNEFEHGFPIELKVTPKSTITHQEPYSSLYLSEWDIPKAVRKKALFGKSQSKQAYSSYDSLLNIYTELNQPQLSNIDQTLYELDSISLSVQSTESLNFVEPFKLRNFLQHNLTSHSNSEYSTARVISQNNIQKSPVSKSNPLENYCFEETLKEGILDFSSESELDHCKTSTANELYAKCAEHSLILEDESSESDDENRIPPQLASIKKYWNTRNEPQNKDMNSKSKSEDNIIPNSIKTFNTPDSLGHTINMSKIGPTYLYVYLNIMYGNWDDFECRTLVKESINHKHCKVLHRSELSRYLPIIKRRSMHEFKKNNSLSKLENIRFAFMNEIFHDQILEVIIRNVKFLCKTIKNKKLDGKVKLEVYRLFFYSFCYESKTPLSFDFATKIINSMIQSILNCETNSLEYCDGLRCLHGILCSITVEDFSGEIFDNCFKEVDSYAFEKQNLIWELLKLVICERLLDANSSQYINYLNYQLRKKMNELISCYVEKDNSKFQEFLLIWRKLFEKRENVVNDKELNDNEYKVCAQNIKGTSKKK